MVGILEDKDRIFTNLYGLHDWRLEGARQRGIWNGTELMLAQSPECRSAPANSGRESPSNWYR